jgi:enamine deaminase RidA (YjgF/YER057c/UK114 family)
MMSVPRRLRRFAVPAIICAALVAGSWYGLRLSAQADTFKKEFINKTRTFSGAVVVHNGGIKTIYVSGQVGRGDDFKAQAISAYENLAKQLAAAGAKPEDVVKVNTYIAGYTPEDRAAYDEAKRKVFPQDDLPASTMVGVQALISPQYRIEVEAIAVVKQ